MSLIVSTLARKGVAIAATSHLQQLPLSLSRLNAFLFILGGLSLLCMFEVCFVAAGVSGAREGEG